MQVNVPLNVPQGLTGVAAGEESLLAGQKGGEVGVLREEAGDGGRPDLEKKREINKYNAGNVKLDRNFFILLAEARTFS